MKRVDIEGMLMRTVECSGLLRAGDRVGVAVSGGADSVALFRLLRTARVRLGITLAVLHFDHALRPESAADAKFVEALARSHDVRYFGNRKDVAAIAARKKWNLEDAARRLRYEFFNDVIEKGKVSRVAVAHTMDDQAETVLARIFRGTGPAGLAGIRPSAAGGKIVRPLLEVRRADLRKYLEAIGQEWREDASNRDVRRQRAHIREKLLPLLQSDFSTGAVERLASLARLSQEEAAFWDALTEDRFAVLATRDANSVSIPVVKLLAPLVLTTNAAESQRTLTERLIRRLYQEARGDLRQLTHAHVDQIIALCERGTSGKRIELPGGVAASREFNALVFSHVQSSGPAIRKRNVAWETQSASAAYQYSIDLAMDSDGLGATDVSIPELGACFRLKVIDWSSPERETTEWRNLLDFERLRPPFVLRSWHPGDAYRPVGRRKTRKLKEMFLSARIPAGERRTWPVLESAGRVVWAKGLDPAHDFSVRADTRVGLLIEERKL